jgi:hypothetical protein
VQVIGLNARLRGAAVLANLLTDGTGPLYFGFTL